VCSAAPAGPSACACHRSRRPGDSAFPRHSIDRSGQVAPGRRLPRAARLRNFARSRPASDTAAPWRCRRSPPAARRTSRPRGRRRTSGDRAGSRPAPRRCRPWPTSGWHTPAAADRSTAGRNRKGFLTESLAPSPLCRRRRRSRDPARFRAGLPSTRRRPSWSRRSNASRSRARSRTPGTSRDRKGAAASRRCRIPRRCARRSRARGGPSAERATPARGRRAAEDELIRFAWIHYVRSRMLFCAAVRIRLREHWPLAAALLITCYCALLRLAAFTQKYGTFDHPAWARVMTRDVAPLARSLRPSRIRFGVERNPYVGGDPISYLQYSREMTAFYQPHVREPLFLATTRASLWALDGQDAAVSLASALRSLLAIFGTYLLGAAVVSRGAGLAAAAL